LTALIGCSTFETALERRCAWGFLCV